MKIEVDVDVEVDVAVEWIVINSYFIRNGKSGWNVSDIRLYENIVEATSISNSLCAQFAHYKVVSKVPFRFDLLTVCM